MKNILSGLLIVSLLFGGFVLFSNSSSAASTVIATMQLASVGAPHTELWLSADSSALVMVHRLSDGTWNAVTLCNYKCNVETVYGLWRLAMDAGRANLPNTNWQVALPRLGWNSITASQIPAHFKSIAQITTFSAMMNTAAANGFKVFVRFAQTTPALIFFMPYNLTIVPERLGVD